MSNEYAFVKLAHAIIKQAVDDWRDICQGEIIFDESLESIRHFFNSEWGAMICGDIDPQYILRKLEEERKLSA